jgi:hypothetical protein
MFEKGKTFVEDHKKEIFFVGCAISGLVIGVALRKHIKTNRFLVNLGKGIAGKEVISWIPNGYGDMDLEGVKALLDANANNSEMFAIFREGLNPNIYSCIQLNGSKVVF